jgi:hypothetical protein
MQEFPADGRASHLTAHIAFDEGDDRDRWAFSKRSACVLASARRLIVAQTLNLHAVGFELEP